MRDFAELAKSLRVCAEGHCESGCMCFRTDLPFAGCTTDFDEDDLKVLAADTIEELLAAVPHWISVEERLPEENKNYLTYGVFLPLGVKAMDMNRFDGTKWLTSADVEITHWMPLPAPPKEVE